MYKLDLSMETEETEREEAEPRDGVDAIRAALGSRLRALRNEQGMSVRELAEKSEVSGGFLSQLENGRVMPSVATLIRIATALGTRVGELFDQLPTPEQVVRAGEGPTYSFPDHGIRDEVLSADAGGEVEVLRSVLEPGASTGHDAYTHETRVEVVHVLEGEAEIQLGAETIRLASGDSVTFSGGIPHGATNPGDAPAVLLWVTTPARY